MLQYIKGSVPTLKEINNQELFDILKSKPQLSTKHKGKTRIHPNAWFAQVVANVQSKICLKDFTIYQKLQAYLGDLILTQAKTFFKCDSKLSISKSTFIIFSSYLIHTLKNK